jgi:hypothetical protein
VYGWPGDVVDRQDPDYLEELMLFLKAKGDHNKAESDKAKREARMSR